MIIRQLRIGTMDVFTYIVGCEATRQALVIDPGGEVERIIEEALKEGLTIKYIVNTHGHWDHTVGNDPLKKLTGAAIVRHQKEPGPAADILLADEKPFHVGELTAGSRPKGFPKV